MRAASTEDGAPAYVAQRVAHDCAVGAAAVNLARLALLGTPNGSQASWP